MRDQEFERVLADHAAALSRLAAAATATAAAVLYWWGRRERSRAQRFEAMSRAIAAGTEVAE